MFKYIFLLLVISHLFWPLESMSTVDTFVADITRSIQENNAPMLKKILTTSGTRDISGITLEQFNLLQYAVYSRSFEIVTLLAPYQTMINASTSTGVTPLMLAAHHRTAAFAQVLLDNGAQVNAQDASGNTPLMTSVLMRYPEMAHTLLTYGADVHLKNNQQQTALDIARTNNYQEMIDLLQPLGTAPKA